MKRCGTEVSSTCANAGESLDSPRSGGAYLRAAFSSFLATTSIIT